MNKEKMHLFYGGPFSQWYCCEFTENGITYNGTEQYMMAKKAHFFGDTESYDLIMSMKEPWDQKAQGKKVKNFNKEHWENYCRPMVRQGNMLKFSQNPELKQYLMNTGDAEIVEASPTDTIWGIGLAENDPRAYDKSQWRGTNWLGIAIMEVRDEFKRDIVRYNCY